MAQGRANAVGPRIASANDDHVLVLRGDVRAVVVLGVQQAFRIGREEVHSEVDALEFPSFDGKVPGPGGAGGQEHGVEGVEELLGIGGALLAVSYGDAGDELNALGGHEVNAALHHILTKLHVGDAVGQEAPHAVRALVNHDLVPNAVELGGGSQACGARAHYGYALSRAPGGDLGRHPPFFEAPLNNRVFDVLDRHRRVGDAQHAGPFAGGGANPPRELGEVIGLQ